VKTIQLTQGRVADDTDDWENFLRSLTRKAPPAKRCKCGSPLGMGERCKRCAAERVRQNQPDERTRNAMAHKNRALW